MSLNLDRPTYPHRPIGSVPTLASMLRISERDLVDIAGRAGGMYRAVKLKTGRQTFDANAPLKPLHARIKTTLLVHVNFPQYLTGSLKGRDYKVNAELHQNQAVVICEDVKGFFGAVSDELVFDIWRHFFKFPQAVSEILTALTVKEGSLPQGAIPSSYLANLALWRDEPLLHAKLTAQGIVYSRYVDDIAVSSKTPLAPGRKTQLIADVYGMLSRNGLSAKREKHEIFPATKRMITTKLVVNRKASLPPAKRSNARAAVHEAELLARIPGIEHQVALTALNKAASRVGELGRFHPNLAIPLRRRLQLTRDLLGAGESAPVITGRESPFDTLPDLAPWEIENSGSPLP